MTPLAVGFGLGFAVAAQVGPVTLLAVRSVIRGGLVIGLAMAAGVALIDATYAAAGAAGAGAALELDALRMTLGILGALVLAAIGARTVWSAFRLGLATDAGGEVDTPSHALKTALTATASNPLTIISWAAVFAAASTAEVAASASSTSMMVAGVLVGSFVWMALLAGALTIVRRRIGIQGLRILDVASGTGILLFACLLGLRTLSGS
jgi:putative LysE/RhtB family amino acid efflux pump